QHQKGRLLFVMGPQARKALRGSKQADKAKALAPNGKRAVWWKPWPATLTRSVSEGGRPPSLTLRVSVAAHSSLRRLGFPFGASKSIIRQDGRGWFCYSKSNSAFFFSQPEPNSKGIPPWPNQKSQRRSPPPPPPRARAASTPWK